MPRNNAYPHFLNSPTADPWKKIGARRRAGVATPLFSVYSSKSVGVGEFPDLDLLAKWAASVGLSLVQLLPMNDTGFNFRPYDSESSFALEPMYLSLSELKIKNRGAFKKEIEALQKNFPIHPPRIDTRIKRAKLELLFKIFEANHPAGEKLFEAYCETNRFWLQDYALFKVLKEKFSESGWADWPEEFKNRDHAALERLEKENAGRMEFFRWLQWQSFLQLSQAKKAAAARGVFLMGDLPFLVSNDSADVWAQRALFKLDLVSGAPPDACFAGGQRWGMPPYNWEEVEGKDKEWRYLQEKLKYAENFYNLYRIDHFVGLFRVWVFPRSDEKMPGVFDPVDETVWEAHGRKILSAMIQKNSMLPCAEDLGTVPECSPRVLKEFGIPGMEIQRWSREYETDSSFKLPEKYRSNAVAAISTHDIAPLKVWWEEEAFAPGERDAFWKYLNLKGEPAPKADLTFIQAALLKINEANSIFSIQLLQDWLSLGELPGSENPDFRINFPGTVSDKNWTLCLPFSLEVMKNLPANKLIKKIVKESSRA